MSIKFVEIYTPSDPEKVSGCKCNYVLQLKPFNTQHLWLVLERSVAFWKLVCQTMHAYLYWTGLPPRIDACH
jgi:hypothetical protein